VFKRLLPSVKNSSKKKNEDMILDMKESLRDHKSRKRIIKRINDLVMEVVLLYNNAVEITG